MGDSNTKFFHAYVKARHSFNAIKGLIRNDGSRCLNQEQIKTEVREFYENLMGSAAEELPMVDRNIVERITTLNSEQQTYLCRECTDQEVKEALFSMDANKALGIDGYNVFFFKKTWNIIGGDVIQVVKQFLLTGFMPKEINRVLLVLIPKCKNACTAKEFRPIACCTVLYKIISKVLANRLQGVLHTLVSENQSAFIKGRVIFDNIILSHELVKGYNRKSISPRCMIKVDLQKAYDSVEWPFVKYLLLFLGFPNMYVEWIMACLTTVSYTINVNGDLTIPFEAKRGLR